MARSRRLVQILFGLFFLFLFLRARYPYEVNIPSDLMLRFSPLAPVFYFIDTLHLPLFFWPAILILFLTPFLGRFFCGWVCPLGTSLDIASHIIKSPSNKRSARWAKFRWVKFGILSGALLLAVFSLNIWGYFDPLAIMTRFTTVLFYPLFALFSNQVLIGATKVPALESIAYPVYDWFKAVVMPENQPHLLEVFSILLLFVFIFGLEKLSRRFWCRNLCPAGALLGFLSQFRFYERIVGESCPVCNRCQVECKMNAIPEGKVKETNKVECIECFSCSEKCPPNAKSITYRFRRKPYYSKPDFARRQFLGTMAAGATTIGLLSIGLPHKSESARQIRPPGAIPENEFLDRCIRCLECVR
ncbi:MAG TPA: 4Fe-4S binding protein, partial [Caldithrix sp.]|nr:4Fe-4S binding protein [Caldithrix sp.]